MKLDFNKHLLSEQALYYGEVQMPEGFEIDREKIKNHLVQHIVQNKDLYTEQEFDKLNRYIKEHTETEFDLKLVNKKTFGNFFKPKERSLPSLSIDPVSLCFAPDFVLLYGVDIVPKSCNIKFWYDNNRRAGLSWDIPLKNNRFVMFPSTLWYVIENSQEKDLNYIQTILYDYT